ncbi:MAG: HD domain-containing protein [Thiofilum sp.]|uniref:HD domain-containing protein n=1 Tax=Thiofilum sp. TaxID=2212733 RepID=UPI0025CBBE49|nr:HD domain-containing protein [Thiofilum sp.]MBK8452207.1 HD domain-containing protein [Thiofilum sp.]
MQTNALLNATDLSNRLAFIQAAQSLKEVLRSAYTANGRQESTAEHTWRLALLIMVLADQLPELDLLKTLKMAVIHDLGEAIQGDIPAIMQEGVSNKSAQERQDLATLLQPLPNRLQQEFLMLWDEYDQASSPEALAVKALDKLETLIQHNQGLNPADFNYAFNLSYGKQYTDQHHLFAALRELVDQDTQAKVLGQ